MNNGVLIMMVIGIAVYGVCSALNGYLSTEQFLIKLDAEIARSKQETKRMKIVAETLSRRPGSFNACNRWNQVDTLIRLLQRLRPLKSGTKSDQVTSTAYTVEIGCSL
jgi:hypothetical protein